MEKSLEFYTVLGHPPCLCLTNGGAVCVGGGACNFQRNAWFDFQRRKKKYAYCLKAGITKNKAKQPSALAVGNTQSLKGRVCPFDGAGAAAGGLWVPPSSPGSLLPSCLPLCFQMMG